MKYGEFEFGLNNGAALFAREWRPERDVRGVVCLVHGLGEHSGRYAHLALALTQAGYVLMTYDQRGHGKSLGQRGHTPSYERLLDDIDDFRQECLRRFPNSPLFLYGHSLGGNLVLNDCLRRQPEFKGVIATSPWLRLTVEPTALAKLLAFVLNKVWPTFSLSNGLDVHALSHDTCMVDSYKLDPLVHDRISVRMFTTVERAGLWAVENAAQFKLPLLLMHGGADRITSVDASANFAAQLEQGCTWKIWPGLFHELHNEPEKTEIIAYLINWLDSLTP